MMCLPDRFFGQQPRILLSKPLRDVNLLDRCMMVLFFIGISFSLYAFISYINVALADVFGMYLASNKISSRKGGFLCERLDVVSGQGFYMLLACPMLYF